MKKTPEQKAEEILAFFQPKWMKKRPGESWSEPRIDTAWGTKTHKGAIACIVRLMGDKDDPADAPIKPGE